MAEFSLPEILSGYETTDDASGKRFWLHTISGSAKYRRHNKFVRGIGAFCSKLSRAVCYTSTRGYGMFLLGFGLLSLLLHFVKDYLNVYEEVPLYVLILGAAFAAAGIPFLTVDKPLFPALQSFRPTDYILFEFFCMKRMQNAEGQRGIPTLVMLVIGLMLAVLGAFVPLWIVAAVILIMAYLFFTFMSPEFSFFVIFLALPFLSEVGVDNAMYLSFMVCITLLSFVRKVMLGKRVLCIEQYDILLFIVMVMLALSGLLFNRGGSLLDPVYMFVLAFGYFLTGSLITNRRLADCVINAVAISSIPVSFMAIQRFIRVCISGELGSFKGVSEPFSSPSSLAAFLIVSVIFTIYFLKVSPTASQKVLYTTVLLLNLFSLCLTFSLSALIALAIGAVAYPITRIRRASGLLVAAVALLPYSIMLLPYEWAVRISSLPVISALRIDELVLGWHSAFGVLRNNLFGGTGVGDKNFIPEYITHGGSSQDSSNFFLQVGCEAGIITLLALVLMFVIRLIHRGKYRKYVKDSQVSILSGFTAASMVSLVAYGAFNYLWSDMTMYYLFWCVFAIGSATLRISRREFDDRVDYYSDGRSADSSSVDIVL